MDEAVARLWRLRRPGAPGDRRSQLDAFQPPAESGLAGSTLRAVALHLRALVELEDGEAAGAQAIAADACSVWSDLLARIEASDIEVAPRAHAFHARLVSRHQPAYAALARKQLMELAGCARLKTGAISATALAMNAGRLAGALALQDVSAAWRGAYSPRLPGLGPIERTAASWFRLGGDDKAAETMRSRAATISGLNSAYPEDEMERWPPVLRQPDLLRFAFAATRLPSQIVAGDVAVGEGGEG